MTAADQEVADIQAKLAELASKIQRLDAEADSQTPEADLAAQLFERPEDSPRGQLEAAKQEQKRLKQRLDELRPQSITLLEDDWRRLQSEIRVLEGRTFKAAHDTTAEYKRIGELRSQADAVVVQLGQLQAVELGDGIEAEAARITERMKVLDERIDDLEDRVDVARHGHTDAGADRQALSDAEAEHARLELLALELRPHSVLLLEQRIAHLDQQIAGVERQNHGDVAAARQQFPHDYESRDQAQAQLDALRASRPDVLDTGHYDDAHAFGWRRPVVIGAAALALAGAVAGGVALATSGGSSNTKPPAAVAPAGKPSGNPSGSSSGVALPPPNVVLDSCLQLAVKPGATTVLPTFLTSPMQPGQYGVVLHTGLGDESGSATAAKGATFVAVPVPFTQFTTIEGITITGPAGPIAPGTFSRQFPFVLDAAHDHATACSGPALHTPAPSAGAPSGTGDVKASAGSFLDQLATNMHTAGGVDALVTSLDRAVIDRYGADRCRAFLGTVVDPTAAFTVLDVSGPVAYAYTSDGQTTTVANTYAVHVQHTHAGQTTEDTIHLARNADGTFGWFTRCTSG